MVHPNRKMIKERPAQEDQQRSPLDDIVMQVPPGYRIPKRNAEVPVRESFTPPPIEPNENRQGHSSRQRDRSPPARRHRRSPSSPRRPRRDPSFERYRRRGLSIRRSPSGNRQVQFAPAVEPMEVSPSHHRGSSSYRRQGRPRSPSRHSRRLRSPPQIQRVIERRRSPRPLALADRLGPQIMQNPRVVRTIQERNPSVLKFENVALEVDLLTFLTHLSRTIRSVVGASREFDYINCTIGPSIFVYVCDQDELDYAVMHPISFHFESGRQDIRPLLLSASITSIPIGDLNDPSLKVIPTLMIRNLIPIQVRQAIAATIDAVQLVTEQGAQVTHVRIPGETSSLARTASLAFVGVSSPEKATELDGLDIERCGKKLPINKSVQTPVLIPTGMSKQQRDADWIRRALASSMLILRPNPFT